MRRFAEIYARAARRKGGEEALEARIPAPKQSDELRAIPDHRWLAGMTRAVFQAGFVWRVVEHKWPGMEEVLQGFDAHAVAYLSDEDLDRLLIDPRLIRHAAKLRATRDNAAFVLELAREHGTAGAWFAASPASGFALLLEALKTRASRLGGMAAQYFLRRMGVDSWILSEDVVRVLIAEDVVSRAPRSRRDLQAVQSAFDHWCAQSGRGLTAVSRVLSMSVD